MTGRDFRHSIVVLVAGFVKGQVGKLSRFLLVMMSSRQKRWCVLTCAKLEVPLNEKTLWSMARGSSDKEHRKKVVLIVKIH